MFEVSGVEVAWWVPPLAAFCISTVFSMGGVSGAFILLPFQVSVLGFTSPAVTPTNHLFNVIAIPGGVYRFIREKRMLWPITVVIIAGTLPGVVIGSWVRVRYLVDPKNFKLFVGLVLLLIGGRLLWANLFKPLMIKLGLMAKQEAADKTEVTEVEVRQFDWRRIVYRFSGDEYEVSNLWLLLLSAVVGLIGGAYGIGGGAIIAPFLVTFFGLPVYTIAGAALMGTFATSVFAVIFFTLLAPFLGSTELTIMPDWSLGALFGVGGLAGTYAGARLQRHLPQNIIKVILAVGVVSVALRYVIGYFL